MNEELLEAMGFKNQNVIVNPYGIKIYLGTKGKDDWCIEVPKELCKLKCPNYPFDYNYCNYLISEERALQIAGEFTGYSGSWKRFNVIDNALSLIKELTEEKSNLEYTLMGVMHSVDKWLEGVELEQDEVNRAATMREKTLQIVEKLTEENERLRERCIPEELLGHPDPSGEKGKCGLFEQCQADTVRKMQEMVYEFPDDLNTIDAYIIKEMIDEIAKEMFGGGNHQW